MAMLMGGETMRDLLIAGRRVDENELQEVMSSSLSALLVALYAIDSVDDGRLVCAFAGHIQEFDRRGGDAVSFYACVKNIVAFQIYAFSWLC